VQPWIRQLLDARKWVIPALTSLPFEEQRLWVHMQWNLSQDEAERTQKLWRMREMHRKGDG
jgi:hypothetical protein